MDEIRIFSMANFEVREADGETPTQIVGYPAVYNELSEDLGGFRETIRPGFFRNVMNQDTRATINHDPNRVLGRNKAGTLVLEDGEKGLQATITPPDTSYANDLMVSMKRGDVDQMSFVFRVAQGGDKWSKVNDGYVLRELLTASELRDVSVVTYPAYPQTSAEARSKASELTAESIQADGEADNQSEKVKAQARLSLKRRRLQIAKRK